MVHTLREVKFNGRTLRLNSEKFDNVDEFYKVNSRREKLRQNWSKEKAENYDFCKTNNYEEAADLLYHGYTEALENYKNALKVRTNFQKKLTFKNDVVGFQPIVPNAIMGLPNSMINSYYTQVKTPVIDIYYDPTFSGSTSTDTILETGRKIINVILNLESIGYKVNLYIGYVAIDDDLPNEIDVFSLKIKESNRPLDINRISFPLAHPAMLRVFGFEWQAKVPDGHERSGYGKPFDCVISNRNDRNFIIQAWAGSNARYFIGSELIKYNEDDIMKMLIE